MKQSRERNWLSRQICQLEILNSIIFVPVPNSGGMDFKIPKWYRIWDGDQNTKLDYPLYRVFQNNRLIYTVNIKWDVLERVTDCPRQFCHIEIWMFIIFIPVPNSGGVDFKITKWCRIWDGDQHTKLQIKFLFYKVNF